MPTPRWPRNSISRLDASSRKPLQQFPSKLRERIVARSHDEDAVAGFCHLHQMIAAGLTIGKGEGIPAAPCDIANDVAAADATIDGATETYRLGHQQHVVAVQPVGEAVDQRVPHQANRTVAMR